MNVVGVGDDNKWKKQLILELEVYLQKVGVDTGCNRIAVGRTKVK